MGRFDGGWVKIHRKAILGDIGANYTRGGLFSTLIAIANIQDSTVSWRGRPRKLERGEIVTSITELSELGETDRKTVDRHLNYLALRDTIIVEKCSSGTLIKILNFDKYQLHDVEQGKRQRNNMVNDRDNDSAHIEEGKNKRSREGRQQLKVSNVEELKAVLTPERLADYAKLYPDVTYLDRELLKALNYYLDNPLKTPKTAGGWKTRISGWLARGWESYKKSLPLHPPRPVHKVTGPIRLDGTSGGTEALARLNEPFPEISDKAKALAADLVAKLDRKALA